MLAFGKKERLSQDWFNAFITDMDPVIEAKRQAYLAYKDTPSEKTDAALRAARSNAQRIARRCANDFWLQLCESIQTASDWWNIRGMFDGIKRAVGRTVKKTAPLKSTTGQTIVDRNDQMVRWVEHYSELYSRETAWWTNWMLNPPLRTWAKPKTHYPAEKHQAMMAYHQRWSSAENLRSWNPSTNCSVCWEEGAVSQDMCDATIVTLYKNKGDRSYCNNYRGISLLSIVRKVFARILLTRLHTLAARIYPESQCGFRAERSTIDMIFTLRQIQEKCREQGKPLYLAFIDLTKAFNLVSRKGLFQLLEKIGCSPKLRSLVVSFHGDMKGTVMYDRSCSDPFPVKSGVKQGIFLASSFHSFCLTPSGHHLTAYIYTHELMANCSASHAFAQRQKCRKSSCYLPMTHPLQPTQKRPYRDFSQSCKDFGLTISIKKTNVSAQDVSQAPSIKIDDHTLDVVEEFTHLGSTISMNLCLDTEINKRIGKASATMAKLTQRVWKNRLLTQKHQGACLPSMHPQHAPLWQWDMDNLHAPGTSTQHLLHALPKAYPGYQVAGPYTQQQHSHAYWGPFYVLSPGPAAPQVAWPCAAHGGRPHSQRCILRSAGIRQPASGAISPPL